MDNQELFDKFVKEKNDLLDLLKEEIRDYTLEELQANVMELTENMIYATFLLKNTLLEAELDSLRPPNSDKETE